MRGATHRWLGFGLAAAVLMLDQLSKHWAEANLSEGVIRPFWPQLLNLQLVYNRGAAFSLFSQATTLLALVSAVVTVLICLWLWQQRRADLLQAVVAGLLLGGTAGNGLDRWRLGAVVDFLALAPIDFPVFNLADVSINLAVIGLALLLLRQGVRHES